MNVLVRLGYALRKKGAIGYIGATNNSVWDEDYYWGVGSDSEIEEEADSYEETGLWRI